MLTGKSKVEFDARWSAELGKEGELWNALNTFAQEFAEAWKGASHSADYDLHQIGKIAYQQMNRVNVLLILKRAYSKLASTHQETKWCYRFAGKPLAVSLIDFLEKESKPLQERLGIEDDNNAQLHEFYCRVIGDIKNLTLRYAT